MMQRHLTKQQVIDLWLVIFIVLLPLWIVFIGGIVLREWAVVIFFSPMVCGLLFWVIMETLCFLKEDKLSKKLTERG